MTFVMTPPVIHLNQDDRSAVLALAQACEENDHISPLNESAQLAVTGPSHLHSHWLARDSGRLVGYAQTDAREGTIQLMVDPQYRRRGLGSALAHAVITHAKLASPDRDPAELPEGMHWWAFANLPGAKALAHSLGLIPARELLIMRLSMPPASAHDAGLPQGYTLDHFHENDLSELVRVNHEAFAHHPEQGQMSADDAIQRMSQDWFDPKGLLVARTPDGGLAGFHWTKIIREHGSLLGEVYVIGVDPLHERKGIGRGLLDAGILHMQAAGVEAIDLYVEASNPRVVQMYQIAGFQVMSSDVAYARQEQN